MANLLTLNEAAMHTPEWAAQAPATALLDSAQHHSGTDSLRVTLTVAGNQGMKLVRQVPNLTPGTTYIHGFWVFKGTGAGQVRSYITYHKADGTQLSDNPGPPVTPIAGWVPVRSEVVADAFTSYVVLWIWWDAVTTAGTMYLDDAVFAAKDPPWRMHNKPSTLHQERRARRSLLALPGVRGDCELQVKERQEGRNLSVDVLAGAAYVQGTDISQQGVYYIENEGKTNVPFTDAHPTLPRITSIFAQVVDSKFSSFAGPPAPDTWDFVAIDGTPAAWPSMVAPASPASSLRLADVLVWNTSRAIADAYITDRRTHLQTQGPQLFTLDGSNILIQSNTGPWVQMNTQGWAQGWGFIPYAAPFPNKTISVVSTDTGPWNGDGKIRVAVLPGQARNGFWVVTTYAGNPYRGWLYLRYTALGQ